MKKIKQVNGLIIAECNDKEAILLGSKYAIFTSEEYAYGPGCRSEEWQADSLKEAEDWCKYKRN